MTIASAAHTAVPSLPAAAASRTSTEDDSGSGSQFARQLSGLTAESADADAWRPAGSANVQRNASEDASATASQQPAIGGSRFTLSRPLARVAGAVRPAPATSKRAASNQNPARKAPRAQTAPGESTLAVPVAVPPVPAPEIEAAIAATADTLINIVDSGIPVKPALPPAVPDEPAEAGRPTVTAATGPAQSAQEMAFAARVQPVQSTRHSALPAEMASAAAVASASKKVVAAAEDENSSPADAHGLLTATATIVDRNAGPNATTLPAAHGAPAAQRTDVPASPAESLSKSSAPLKDISLQVNQPGKERVDVRVVQQGSEVHVSVHSGDASLTSGLRQGLSDLQSRLEENGYRSETWRPGASTAPLSPAPSSQASTNHSRGGDGQPQQGGSQQQESGRRNPNQSNQPRWVEELDSSLTGGEKTSGGFYGFRS